MTKDHKRRQARRKLKAHDSGNDRHHKILSLWTKQDRLTDEHNRQPKKRRRKS